MLTDPYGRPTHWFMHNMLRSLYKDDQLANFHEGRLDCVLYAVHDVSLCKMSVQSPVLYMEDPFLYMEDLLVHVEDLSIDLYGRPTRMLVD